MLVARGYHVGVFLEDGRAVKCAAGSEILHDEQGVNWHREEVLVMPYRKTGKTLTRVPAKVRKHFGDGYDPKKGVVTLPPRRLSGWEEVGLVERIEYTRRGDLADDYEHSFGERRGMFKFGSGKKPVLYKRGEVLRIVGVRWDWAGAS